MFLLLKMSGNKIIIKNGATTAEIPTDIFQNLHAGQQFVISVNGVTSVNSVNGCVNAITMIIRFENIPPPTIILPTVVLAEPHHEINEPNVTTIIDDAENEESVINEVVVAPLGSRENPIIVE